MIDDLAARHRVEVFISTISSSVTTSTACDARYANGQHAVSNMTLNPQPLHIDRHFCAEETEWASR
jgi:acyl dehydratase